jgi:transposase-like protein
MANSVLSDERFHNEEAAFVYVEAQLWPNGPVCPFCGATSEHIGRLNVRSKPSKKHPQGVAQVGLRKCYACRKQFTVRVGSIFEDSHLPLHLWLQAIHLMCSSKKGISTRQLQRTLQCGLKTAWHLGHRIRHAMDPFAAPGGVGQLGGHGKTVEADETAITNSQKTKRGPGRKRPKMHVLSLVERGGRIRSMKIDHRNVGSYIREHVNENSRLVTDMAPHYKFSPVAKHETVDHSKYEWARGDVHTNTLEGFFSIVKRGLVGIYQRVSEKHIDRYLTEFDFRHNHRIKLCIDDVQRTEIAVRATKGKRLMYRDSSVPFP